MSDTFLIPSHVCRGRVRVGDRMRRGCPVRRIRHSLFRLTFFGTASTASAIR